MTATKIRDSSSYSQMISRINVCASGLSFPLTATARPQQLPNFTLVEFIMFGLVVGQAYHFFAKIVMIDAAP